MAKFKDRHGREWAVSLTLADFRRLREEAGVELNDALADADTFAGLLYGDPFRLGRIMWVLCGRQAAAAGLTEDQFADGFDADALVRCGEAAVGALVDFFHPRQAAVIRPRLADLLARMDAAMAPPTPPSPPGGSSAGCAG